MRGWVGAHAGIFVSEGTHVFLACKYMCVYLYMRVNRAPSKASRIFLTSMQ